MELLLPLVSPGSHFCTWNFIGIACNEFVFFRDQDKKMSLYKEWQEGRYVTHVMNLLGLIRKE